MLKKYSHLGISFLTIFSFMSCGGDLSKSLPVATAASYNIEESFLNFNKGKQTYKYQMSGNFKQITRSEVGEITFSAPLEKDDDGKNVTEQYLRDIQAKYLKEVQRVGKATIGGVAGESPTGVLKSKQYLSTNYMLVGKYDLDFYVREYWAIQNYKLPTDVKAGATGTLYKIDSYNSPELSSTNIIKGSIIVNYSIEAYSSTSAYLKLNYVYSNFQGVSSSLEEVYMITTSKSLTPVSSSFSSPDRTYVFNYSE